MKHINEKSRRKISEKSSIKDEESEEIGYVVNTSGSSFTKKLYEILERPEMFDIISWTPGIEREIFIPYPY